MTKAEFLEELCRGMRFCSSSDEVQRMVNFYSEAIDDRMEDGMTEEEAVAAMGNIDDIISEAESSRGAEAGEETPRDRVRPGKVERVFSTAVVSRIEVYDTSGTIDILPSPDGQIHIEYTVSDLWRYDITGESTVTVRRAKNGGWGKKLTFGICGRDFSIPLPSFNGAFTEELHLKLLLPTSAAPSVSVNTASGDVECRNVSPAGLYVKLASGDVTVEDVMSSGRAGVSTVSGDVEIRGLTASEVSVNTVSGDIDLDAVRTDALMLNTVSGDTEATDLAVGARLNIGSVSGDLTFVLVTPCERVSFTSVSGDVELDLAGAESLYAVTAKTTSGNVNVSGAPAAGPNQVCVKTMSGDIDVGFEE